MRPERFERTYPCLGNEFKMPGALFWARMAVALLLLGLYQLAELSAVLSALVLSVAALAAGYDILSGAIEDAMALELRRERLPILLAVLLSLFIERGRGAVIALLILQLGYLAADYGLYRSQKSISAALKAEINRLMDAQESNSPCARLYARMRAGYAVMTDREKALMRASRYLLPAAVLLSLILLAVLPLAYKIPFAEAVRRVAAIIAISSPLSLFLFLPLTYYAAMAAGGGNGAFLLDAKAAEDAGRLRALVFDKTGTLTGENFHVTDIRAEKLDAATFLKAAAHAAEKLDTPAARAVVTAYGKQLDESLIQDVHREPGEGVLLNLDGLRLHFGTDVYFEEMGLALPLNRGEGLRLNMAANGIYAGSLILAEAAMQGLSPKLINSLSREKIETIAMISGDSREKDSALATLLGIDEYYSECSVEDKIKVLHEVKERTKKRGRLALVGGAALSDRLFAKADFCAVVTDKCGDKALETADALILKGDTGGLLSLIRTGKLAFFVSLAGLGLVAAVKLLVLLLAVFGYAPLWFAVLLDICAALGALLGCTTYFLRPQKRQASA